MLARLVGPRLVIMLIWAVLGLGVSLRLFGMAFLRLPSPGIRCRLGGLGCGMYSFLAFRGPACNDVVVRVENAG